MFPGDPPLLPALGSLREGSTRRSWSTSCVRMPHIYTRDLDSRSASVRWLLAARFIRRNTESREGSVLAQAFRVNKGRGRQQFKLGRVSPSSKSILFPRGDAAHCPSERAETSRLSELPVRGKIRSMRWKPLTTDSSWQLYRASPRLHTSRSAMLTLRLHLGRGG